MSMVQHCKYYVCRAQNASDLRAAQLLRAQAFRPGGSDRLDRDAFDKICVHFLVRETRTDQIVCCFRILPLCGGSEISRSYSAQFYELKALEAFPGKMVEIGRFCVRPGWYDPDVLRLAWGALTSYVDDNDIELLFGCSSFAGIETDDYLDAFAILRDRHLAPSRWLPRIKAPDVIRFAASLRHRPDARKAMSIMPPLLRMYLLMGGWVSDHAVVDHEMNTLHVFTGLEVGAIPPARKKWLRAVAAPA